MRDNRRQESIGSVDIDPEDLEKSREYLENSIGKEAGKESQCRDRRQCIGLLRKCRLCGTAKLVCTIKST